jgi:hypothetical protein
VAFDLGITITFVRVLSAGGVALGIFKNRSIPLDVEIAVYPTEFATL